MREKGQHMIGTDLLRPSCPSCDNSLILPYGESTSDILIVGDQPELEDYQLGGLPFQGPRAKILNDELQRVGIMPGFCRMTYMWLHSMDKKTLKEEGHADWHLGQLVTETSYHDHIFMCGTELPKYFVKKSITEVSGLEIYSPLIARKISFAPDPNTVRFGTIGEFRLAVEKFQRRVTKVDP
jgi:uracil-DNA glycosylase